jgi:hypothetical protein
MLHILDPPQTLDDVRAGPPLPLGRCSTALPLAPCFVDPSADKPSKLV